MVIDVLRADHLKGWRAAAMAARAAGDHDRAAAAWRGLLDVAPDDWRVALELKRDLVAGLHNPDSDGRFCRAARMLPDAAWLAHYGECGTLPGAELEAIAFRAREMRERVGADVRIEGVLGQVARQRRDWSEAARAFSAAFAMAPGREDWARLAAQARMYARLGGLGADGGVAGDYEVFVINLDRNAERLAEIERQCVGFPVRPQRVGAVAGDTLPGAAVRRLTGEVSAPRGTLGCFLSHAAAWERLLAGSAACALVMEDDALPLLAFPRSIAELGLPEGWDVVWVNDRMQGEYDPDTVAGFRTVAAVNAVRGFPAWHDAVGGDGYLISRSGARRLLEWCQADGFSGDVDWRMLGYALEPGEVAGLACGSAARRLLDGLPVPGRAARLQAHVLQPALVREVSLRSDRQDVDRLAAAA
jgi:GR25 family glycosyltransferase involved in LPS biosynthesis